MESAFDIDLSGEGDDALPPGVQPGTLGGTDVPPEEPVETPTAVDPSEEEVEEARSAMEAHGEGTAAAPAFDTHTGYDGGLDAGFEAALEGDDDDWQPEPEPEGDETFTPPDGPAVSDFEPTPEEAEGQDDFPDDAPAEPELPAEVAAETGEQQDAQPSQENPTPNPTPKPKRQRKKAKSKAATPPKTGTGGSVTRMYFIFEEMQVEIEGQIVPAYRRLVFSDNGTKITEIKARNRDLALRKAGNLLGHGYEGDLVAVPTGSFQSKLVKNKPRERWAVEVG